MADHRDKPSADLNGIVEQTQPAALQLLDTKGLNGILRELRAMKANETELQMQKALAQAIRRAAAEKRSRQPAAVAEAAPVAPSEPETLTKAEKAEEKRRKQAEKIEKKRVKEAERAEHKSVNAQAKADRQAAKAAGKKPKADKTGAKAG